MQPHQIFLCAAFGVSLAVGLGTVMAVIYMSKDLKPGDNVSAGFVVACSLAVIAGVMSVGFGASFYDTIRPPDPKKVLQQPTTGCQSGCKCQPTKE